MSVIDLQIQPTQTSVKAYAEDAVRATRATQNMTLDYSLSTLQVVDFVLDEWKRLGAPLDQINKSLYAFGSYVGETVKRLQAGAEWFKPEEAEVDAQRLANLPFLALRLADGQLYRPINHAFLIMATKPMEANVWKVTRRLLKQ